MRLRVESLIVRDRPGHLLDARVIKSAIVIVVAGAVSILILLHTPLLNGPPFWEWPWRRLPALPTYGFLALGAVPLVLAHIFYERWRVTALALVLVMIGCFTLKLASLLPYTRPASLAMIPLIVQDREATSYYTDAAALNAAHSRVRDWLAIYHEYMPALSLHSKTKAPGPILYYTAFIETLAAGERTALLAGLVLGVIATLSIPATFLLIHSLTGRGDAAFYGAAFLALCPGFVLFFPMFDPTYGILSCALILAWARAVERDDWRWAIGLGVVLAATCTISFNVLVIGAFMALYPFVVPDVPIRAMVVRTARLGAIAIVTWLALLALLRPVTGYDALATFASAWRNQHTLLEIYAQTRPYPQTVPFDLSDFAMGSGWVSVPLVILFFLSRRAGESDASENAIDSPRLRRLAALCVAQLVIVAATGLLQSETARVWNFMLPLLMIPIGLELTRWTWPGRAIVYACVWLVLAVVAQNMKLIY